MSDLEEVRRSWIVDLPLLAKFGQMLVGRLRTAIQREGVWAEVSSRPKDIDSILRKLIKKPKYTYETLGDKTGVRIIVRYLDELPVALQAASNLFDCRDVENKADTLTPEQVGYLSIHADMRLREGDGSASEFPPDKFRAELQVRTLAQHLWSEMSHDTFYKNDDTLNPLPVPIKRRIYTLAGVVEVADNEFNRINGEIPAIPEIELLKVLERNYFKLTTRRGDAEISLDVIRLLLPLYDGTTPQVAAQLNRRFSEAEEMLRDVYEDKAPASERSAFLFQPEALMLLDRLKSDPISIRKLWNTKYPEKELERIANAFGLSFD